MWPHHQPVVTDNSQVQTAHELLAGGYCIHLGLRVTSRFPLYYTISPCLSWRLGQFICICVLWTTYWKHFSWLCGVWGEIGHTTITEISDINKYNKCNKNRSIKACRHIFKNSRRQGHKLMSSLVVAQTQALKKIYELCLLLTGQTFIITNMPPKSKEQPETAKAAHERQLRSPLPNTDLILSLQIL